MAAFMLAIEAKSQGIELDVHCSKDGEVVIVHDERVNRTTNGQGLVKDHTLCELQALDAGSWYGKDFSKEKIPTLRELLSYLKDKDILLNIELKSGVILYPKLEEKVAALIKEYDFVEKTVVSSFNHYALQELKKHNPEIKTGVLLVAGLIHPWEYAVRADASALHPLFYAVDKQMVAKCHEYNLQVNTYTVNEVDHIKAMFALGVDGLITNYPSRAFELFWSK